MPDLAECIRLHHEAEAARPAGATIRVYRVGATWSAGQWRDHARYIGYCGATYRARSAQRNADLSAQLGVPVAEIVGNGKEAAP